MAKEGGREGGREGGEKKKGGESLQARSECKESERMDEPYDGGTVSIRIVFDRVRALDSQKLDVSEFPGAVPHACIEDIAIYQARGIKMKDDVGILFGFVDLRLKIDEASIS